MAVGRRRFATARVVARVPRDLSTPTGDQGSPFDAAASTSVAASGVGVGGASSVVAASSSASASGVGAAGASGQVAAGASVQGGGVAAAGAAGDAAPVVVVAAGGVAVAGATFAVAATSSVTAQGAAETGDAYTDVVLNDAPASWWRLQDASGLPQDSSGNAHHMTAKTGASQTYQQTRLASGIAAYSIDAAADANVFTASNPSWSNPTGTSPFSVEGWIAVDTWTTGFPRLFSRQYSTPSRNSIDVVWHWDGATSYTISVERWVSGAAVGRSASVASTPGRTYHVVATYDGSAVRLYIDGAVVGSAAADVRSMPDLTLGPSDVRIAMGDAKYADIAFYDYALTAAQVSEHYTVGTGSGASTVGASFSVAATATVAAQGVGVAAASSTVAPTGVVAGGGVGVAVPGAAVVSATSTVAAQGRGDAGASSTIAATTTVVQGPGVTLTGGASGSVAAAAGVEAAGWARALPGSSSVAATVTVEAQGRVFGEEAVIVGVLGRPSRRGAAGAPRRGASAGTVAGRFRPYTSVGVRGEASEA